MDSFIQVEADEPDEEPLTREEVARQLGMGDSELASSEDYIDGLSAAARQSAETYTRRRLIDQHVNWQPHCGFRTFVMDLPFANVTEIVSINYVDTDGVERELSVTQDEDIRYVLPVGEKCGRGTIEPAYGKTWPATRPVSGAVTIRLKAGYGPKAERVPAGIKRGMLALIAHWDRSKEAVNVGNITSELPFGVKWSWMPFRTH